MLDNLRDDASTSPFFEEEEIPDFLEEEETPARKTDLFGWLAPIRALTPMQRFIISMMLLTTVCLLGTMFLLVTERFMLF